MRNLQKEDKGFSLLEVLLVLAIISVAMPMFYQKYVDYLDEKRWIAAANHAEIYNEAAKRYIADNAQLLLAGAISKKITPETLIKENVLKEGFAQSPFGQSYVTGVVKNRYSGQLEALTCSTGGQTMSLKAMVGVAGLIKGMGGYIEDNQVEGAYNTWGDKPSEYGLRCEDGHIAIALSSEIISSAIEESDRLYRYEVNNRPELNRMHTAIDMNGHDLKQAGTITGQKGEFNQDVTSNNGWLITKNNKGWLNSTYGGGFYMTDEEWIRAVNNKSIYTDGRVHAGALEAQGNVQVGGILQLDKVVVEGTSCPQTGAFARDAAGNILACQSGRWQRDSAATGKLSYYSGQWGSYANFGKHVFCALTTHEANGDRGTGWYLSQEQGNWHMRYYNLSAWGVTCFD